MAAQQDGSGSGRDSRDARDADLDDDVGGDAGHLVQDALFDGALAQRLTRRARAGPAVQQHPPDLHSFS